MFSGGKKSSEGPIGVDIGDHTIRLLQLTWDGDRWSAVAAGSRALSQGLTPQAGQEYHDAVAHAVREILSTGHFKGRRAVSCLPATSLIYKNIRLPKMPRDELASAVQWEASERLKFSGETMSVQFLDAGEVMQGQDARQEAIILAAPNRFVEKHVESLQACDLDLEAIDAVPGALARCLSHADLTLDEHENEPAVRVVLDIGYGGTKVLILKGQRVCFFKLIEVGGRHMDEALAEKLDLPMSAAVQARREWAGGTVEGPGDARITSALCPVVEELAHEISLCLRYYSVTFRGRRPDEAWVAGGEAGNPWLWAKLCENAGLRPMAHDPMTAIDLTRVREAVGGPESWSSWAVAAGLALRTKAVQKRNRRGAA
ncbi:MAG: hypothetical protein Kow00105_18030 [Phycisphaeraceae bacterium]